jgi:hypothetical protein
MTATDIKEMPRNQAKEPNDAGLSSLNSLVRDPFSLTAFH